MTTDRNGSGTAWAGWILFAGAMLVMIGALNILEGIFALIWDERLVVTPARLVIVDITGWGWTLLVSGAIFIVTGLGLLAGQTWARVTSIVIVILHALAQIAWLSAYPVWSVLMIVLDVVVLYALTARWSAARDTLDLEHG
jgi:hypothetical protein